MNMLLYLSQQVRIVAVTTPAGSNTDVQYNDNGAFGGDGGLTYDKNTVTLTISGNTGAVLSGNSMAGGFFDNAGGSLRVCDGVLAIGIGGKIGTNQVAAATTLGNVVGAIPIHDVSGTLLGFLPVYDAIT